MKIIIYSETNAATIHNNIGRPEYSYYYVLKSYLPLLRRFAEVITVTRPERDVDEIYRSCALNNEPCYFLSFSPPHRTITTLRCPTIAVFAWEFDTIPDEQWGVDPRSDWRYVLSRLAGAIVHSSYTERVVKQAMGESYPVITIPSPLWTAQNAKTRHAATTGSAELRFSGWLFDTQSWDCTQFQSQLDWDRKGDGVILSPINAVVAESAQSSLQKPGRSLPPGVIQKHVKGWLRELQNYYWPKPKPLVIGLPEQRAPEYFSESVRDLMYSEQHKVVLEGVVYTTVLNPVDGRKNLALLVREFCEAFKTEARATLVIKSTHFKPDFAIAKVIAELLRQPDFQCRVIVISGYLDDECYAKLLQRTSFALNASYGEGQCLPLMEYMSEGIPAISPNHTALADYVSAECAFVVDHYAEPAAWPHDPRQVLSTFKHQIKTSSLRTCYRQSFVVAGDDDRYRRMSEAATRSAENYCSIELLERKLKAFLDSDTFRSAVERDRARKETFGTLHLTVVDSTSVRSRDAELAGWFLTESSEVISGVRVGGDDVVLDAGSLDAAAAVFCAGAGARVIHAAGDIRYLTQLGHSWKRDAVSPFIGVACEFTALALGQQSATKILALEILERVADPTSVMKELVRVGRSGAQYVLSVTDHATEQVARQVAPVGCFEPPQKVNVFSRANFVRLVEEAGLIVEDYRQDGFYWALWTSLYWVGKRAEGHNLKGNELIEASAPYGDALECWAKTWGTLLSMPGGEQLKKALDGVLPQRQTIIARKP